ncbi:hypothetical protein BBP40_011245 [Aspergillus hancockii]|nr:hypothetical protein BBP40_011245 [Aspergillus hancockii]
MVEAVAFSPDGQTVASGSDDKTIKLWDAKTGSELQALKGHLDSVGSVAFSPDGQIVASGSDDETIKLWDAKTGTELQTLKGHSDSVGSVANTLHADEYTGSPQLHEYCDQTTHGYTPVVSLSNNWVVVAGEDLLWLPPEHRQISKSATKDATVAFGYFDGRVTVIGFHAP